MHLQQLHEARFVDRRAAGRQLAQAVAELDLVNPIVLALPRGGVPVAVEVALALRAPLDLILVRKIGVPEQPELACAALVEGDPPRLVRNEEVIAAARVSTSALEKATEREHREITRRRTAYLGNRVQIPVEGRTVIVVDDGIATGTCIRAALLALRGRHPARLVLAVPVAPAEIIAELAAVVDDVVCLATPSHFQAIGLHYQDFHQLEDEEVTQGLAAVDAALRPGAA